MTRLPFGPMEAFVAVARVGSLARAATALNVSVPAVSRRIHLLERYLGVRLFERLPRGVALTDAGQRYFAELGPAWESIQAATAAAKAAPRRHPLRISVIPTFAANWLLPRLARRGRPASGVNVELETAPDIVDLTVRNDLDCAIRLGRGPWQGTRSQPLMPVEAFPVASPGLVLGDRLRTPEELSRYTLIGSNHQPDFWPEWFRLSRLPFRPMHYKSFDNLQLVYEAAVARLGIAIGLSPLVQPYLASGRLVRVWQAQVTLSRAFHLVRRTDVPVDGRFERFRDWLLREAGHAV